MNDDDNGFFEYNKNYPPLFIKPPVHQEVDYKQSMEGSITSYLQDSKTTGTKHPDAILPNGMCAGEAGVLYFREINHKRKKDSHIDLKICIYLLAIFFQVNFKEFFNPALESFLFNFLS